MTLRNVLSITWCAALTAAAGACGSSTTGSTGATTTSTSTGTTMVNGCDLATAVDKTASMTYDLTADAAWAIPHKACVKVKAGTTVTWKGDFTFHPLSGGLGSGMADAASPITTAGKAVTGMGTVTVKLDKAGAYPYYCTLHLSSMQGVVYVE